MVREHNRVLPSRMKFTRNLLLVVPCFTKLDSNTVDPRYYPIFSNLVHTYVCMYGHTYSKSMDHPGKVANVTRGHLTCVLCVFFTFILDIKFVWMYQPEVTQDFSSTFFLRCMPSFLARRIQPFLSLVDREVEIYVRFTSLGMCVCVVFFSQIVLDIKFVGRTSRGHTGGKSHRISHPPSFGGACLNFFFFFFLARRIQPFLFLSDREVEFCAERS